MTSRIKPCFMVAGLSLCFCVSALASVNCQTQCAQIRYPDRNVVDKMVKKKCYYRPRGVEVVYPGLAYSSHGLDDGSNEAYNKCKDKDRICWKGKTEGRYVGFTVKQVQTRCGGSGGEGLGNCSVTVKKIWFNRCPK